MRPLKIGIVAEAIRLPLRQSLAVAARAGASGVQVDALGDLSPVRLGDTGRRELRNLLRSFDLQLAALNVPLRRGLDVAEDLQPRIERIKKAMQLAFDLGTCKVVIACPRLPTDEAEPRANLMRESLAALGAYGDRMGCLVALEVGFDPADQVKQYFASFDCGSLKITFDPVNFMLHGHDAMASLMPLTGLVTHVHARDGRSAGLSRGVQEVPVGAGDIDWMAFTATLQVLEFDGFLTVDREQGENQLADVTSGVNFLKRFVFPM